MSTQKFSAAQREALWLAYQKKCPYTSALLDLSNFHIDHILPETLAGHPEKLKERKDQLGLHADFNLYGYENLLPCQPGANLQKGDSDFTDGPTHFFLSLASGKVAAIEQNLANIAKRNTVGRALILLQQALEKGDLTASQVAGILEKYTEQPKEIFTLLQGLKFAGKDEVEVVAKAEIDDLRDRPIKLGRNEHIDGVMLTRDPSDQVYVRTCQEYDSAIEDGFYARTTFDIKMAVYFRHQCGLLKALQAATTPLRSFVSKPHVGVVDLELLPFSMFPVLGPDEEGVATNLSTYQDKVNDGSLVVTQVRQNLLSIQRSGGGMAQHLIEVARADFNGDGLEDILLFHYFYVTDGTFGSGGILILTRKTPDGLFEIASTP